MTIWERFWEKAIEVLSWVYVLVFYVLPIVAVIAIGLLSAFSPSLLHRIMGNPEATATPRPRPTAAATVRTSPPDSRSRPWGSSGGSLVPGAPGKVYVPDYGYGKYHSSPSCSGMDSPVELDWDDAIIAGHEPCKKCN